MTKFMSTSESFFDYDFNPPTIVRDDNVNDQDDGSESDYEELQQQIYFERRKRLKPLTDKLSQWRQSIRSAVGKMRDLRGSSGESSRANSAMSFNSAYSGGRSSPALEVIDFIDDDYLTLRRRVRVYHHHLRRVFAHLNNALKRGPPLGGRLDALKTTFKSGAVDQFPEEKLAKCFGDFCMDLTSDGQLAMSLRDSSDAFNASASLRQCLVKTARSGFLAPLTEFLTRDWKEICVKDKSLQQLAKKIQKAKIEGKLSQIEVNAMMSQFTIRRADVISNFEYILRSEIPLTKRLINLVDAYKIFYLENAKVFHGLETSLRMHLGQPLPEALMLEEEVKEEDLATEKIESQPEISLMSTNHPSHQQNQEPKKVEHTPEVNSANVIGLGNGDASGLTMAHLLLNGKNPVLSARQSIWEANNLKPMADSSTALSSRRSAARAYGFVRTAYSATGADELSLCVGDLVYLDTKLKHADTERIWVCGELSQGTEKKAGLFPLDVVEVIIDL